ncbi:hypothetical protein GCM10015536_44160 [Streptomyces griseomycini]|nr:hypothetical protein GCM10015536_44160 [Streptomyces griseomycini]
MPVPPQFPRFAAVFGHGTAEGREGQLSRHGPVGPNQHPRIAVRDPVPFTRACHTAPPSRDPREVLLVGRHDGPPPCPGPGSRPSVWPTPSDPGTRVPDHSRHMGSHRC